MIRLVSIVVFFLFSFAVFSFGGDSLPDYEPYQDSEFPQWAKGLRRGEIVFFGTIPFTFFISSFSYNFYIYASNNYDSEYAPALFGNKTPPVLSNTEKLQIIKVSVSISSFLAILDYILGKPWND
ncbi:MAG: hypothetical protein J7L71_06190 [Spirochaetaceae bacterium]|nr:hypothetical protein [Spirochaetaceae bacterium]